MIDIYSEIIIDHYKNPRNFGRIENADVHISDSNPFCGDVIEFFLKLDDGRIREIKFQASGCAISIASASMISEKIKGMKMNEIKELDKKFVLKILNIDLSPTRLKCALLPLAALKSGMKNYF